jgi:hypothetical protein
VLAALGTTTLAGAGLATVGLSLVRHSTAGRYVEPPVGPDEPGYQAYVAATPTLAVVHRDTDGDLVGAALLALRPGDDGGSVVLVPPSTLAPAGRGQATVTSAYADGGAESVADVVTDLLDVAVEDTVEVDDDRLATLVGPVAPVTVTLDAPVGPWPAGDVSVAASEVASFLGGRPAGEPELDRMARQAALWTAWLAQVADGGEGSVPGETDAGLGRFLTGVARDATVSVLPVDEVTPVGDDAGATFVVDPERAAELVGQAVPYPLSPAPGRRVRVRLLNGTPDAELTPVAARLLVQAGAEITIAGNASSFAVEGTTFSYRGAGQRADAERLAEAIGVGEVTGGSAPHTPAAETTVDPEAEIDVTIVLGDDARDLIRRLENAG